MSVSLITLFYGLHSVLLITAAATVKKKKKKSIEKTSQVEDFNKNGKLKPKTKANSDVTIQPVNI